MGKKQSSRGEAEQELSGQLKAMFDTIAAQPIPETLNELVEALEEKRRYQQQREEEA